MITLLRQNGKSGNLKPAKSIGHAVWIHLENPSEGEVREFCTENGLDPDHFLDALDQNEAPRFEMEGKDAYIFTRVPSFTEETDITVPVLFVITGKRLVTVVKKRVPVFVSILEHKRILPQMDRISLFIELFDEIITSYTTLVIRVNRQVMAAGIKIEGIENRDIVSLVNQEYVLNECLNALVQTYAFLNVLISKRTLFSDPKDREIIEDLFLATGQIITLSKSSLSNARNIRDAYSTIMTNNLNRVIKFFTTLTIILTIPTIIGSFYGMNVALPFDDEPWVFFGLVGLTIIVCGSLFFYFSRKKWL